MIVKPMDRFTALINYFHNTINSISSQDTHGSLSRAAAEAPLNQSSTSGDSLSFSVFSLMVWGSPGSFGVLDKERRMAAIGSWVARDSDHDVYLLNDLWMRADHGIIRHSLPEGRHLELRAKHIYSLLYTVCTNFVKLRQGSGKDRQGMVKGVRP